MKLNLIPQPQFVQRNGHRLASDFSNVDVVIHTPVADNRLYMLGQCIFGQVTPFIQGSDVYALHTVGLPLNLEMLNRIKGKQDGYVLIINEGSLEIYALTASGLFYGMKTIEQLLHNYNGHLPALTIVDWADLQLRSDYLDLRTVYPTFEHMLEYIAELASYKINTLVVEYEDKLPFRKLSFLRHSELVFSDEHHKQLLQTAHEHFVQIIPKQQSFGHLEYILKHPQFIDLRETPSNVGELCPHRSGSFEMMEGILEEIAELHPHSEYLHLGCDEVWSLGTCEDCLASGLSRELSFVRFVNRLIDKACSLGKKPMIWHDMLAHAAEDEIAQLDKRVIVVVWIYGGYRMKADAKDIIRKLRSAGVAVIGASAVRCWDDQGDQNYPVIQNRIKNVLDWVELAQSEQLSGIINTNWSAPFSLGSPYGLFETSRYPAFFAADCNWNVHADSSDFLKRFLLQYHGVSTEGEEASEQFDYVATDYYQLIPRLLPDIQHNLHTAELIAAMIQFELPAKRRFPLHTFLFRGEMSEVTEEVVTTLKHKYELAYGDLRIARTSMFQILSKLLTPTMVELFMNSRFYLFDLYEAKLQSMLEKHEQNDKEAGE
ncbi:family 20 glycosylhydrolase [Paenibacillus paridis]|uniref:family 20 glycosylhydrolase n=1 Tax=Paenibacillus paridis TaxID=2583376 RepID=UPI001391FCDE|nr:family 20 glycosylhydrolase [Paenibacillus paridis]